jgi:hypothetical protein
LVQSVIIVCGIFLFESAKGRDYEMWMEDKIRSDHRELVYAAVNWIEVAEDQPHWQNVLSKVGEP